MSDFRFGDIADDDIETGLDLLALHDAGRCDDDCPYCAEDGDHE